MSLGSLRLCAALAFLSSAPGRAAGFSRDSIGTTGVPSLELPASARAAAMGGAQGAIAQDATALSYNPAALAGLEGGSLSLMHAAYFGGIADEYGAAAQRLGAWGVVAAGVQYASPGSIDEIDNTGAPTGATFKPDDTVVSLGYAGSLEKLSLGGAVKAISSRLHSSAATFAMDLGCLVSLDRLMLAVSAANIGPPLKYGDKSAELPASLRFGSGYKIHRWILAVDGIFARGSQPTAFAGAEYAQPFFKVLSMAGRIGYSTQTLSSRLGGLAGLSLGAGVETNSFTADYSWSPYGSLGDAHRVSVGFRWGNAGGKRKADAPPRVPWSVEGAYGDY